ncbi:MAG: protein-tyrosine phosphatase family protein [Pseudomonadota bacterium]
MELFKVVELGTCFFAIAAKPSSESVLSDLTMLKDAGVDVVFSLIEPEEAAWLDLSSEDQAATLVGLQYENYPMPDRKPPSDLDQFLALTRHVLVNLESGSSTVVHCVGGIGRSGLVALAVLLNRGYEVGAAIDLVSEIRGRKAPDTHSQIDWFQQNAALLTFAD